MAPAGGCADRPRRDSYYALSRRSYGLAADPRNRRSEVGRGFPIHLPPGEDAIRVLDAAGQTVPDSQKRLVAFGPRRPGIGFEVVPLMIGLSAWFWRREQVKSARSLSIEQRRRMA